MNSGAIGPTIDAIRETLDDLLGTPKRKQSGDSVVLIYRVESEIPPIVPMRLKVEINTREHFSVLGFREHPFYINSRWYKGGCKLRTFDLDELLGTKLRALYQRRKGRDLFDLWLGLTAGNANPEKVVQVFRKYIEHEDLRITRREFQENLLKKIKMKAFLADTDSLLKPDILYEAQEAYHFVEDNVIQIL